MKCIFKFGLFYKLILDLHTALKSPKENCDEYNDLEDICMYVLQTIINLSEKYNDLNSSLLLQIIKFLFLEPF